MTSLVLGPGPRRSERLCELPGQLRASSPMCGKHITYSRLMPDSGWGDILGWAMGGGWSIRFSSSISSLEGLRGVRQKSQKCHESRNIPEEYCLMVWKGLYLE